MRLWEAVSQKLFHFTSIYNAFHILRDGAFKLRSSVGTDSEKTHQKGSRFFYLSTTRSKIGDYTLHSTYKQGVVFNLNGDWFNRRYKGAAVDYWEQWWVKQRQHGSDRHREMEDRIFSPDPVIKLPSKITEVIEEIHVLLHDEWFDEPNIIVPLRKFLILAKKNNIPTFYYNEKNAFLLQNKNKAVPIRDIIGKLKGQEPSWSRTPTDWVKPWRELYYAKNKDAMSKKARDLLYKIQYDWRNEQVTQLKAEIHNSRSQNPEALAKLMNMFRKEKITSAEEYIKLIKSKWGLDD